MTRRMASLVALYSLLSIFFFTYCLYVWHKSHVNLFQSGRVVSITDLQIRAQRFTEVK